jgi:dienelactone hydrolase
MIKRLLLFILTPLVIILVSCGGKGKPGDAIPAVEKTDSCRLDPKNRYEVYIPPRNSATGKLPLLVIIDPHANGKAAIDKFIPAVETYPAIVVASDLVKNNFVNYDVAIKALIDDVRQKYPASETVFLTGFSGGARMALGYALNHRSGGLILAGALASADQLNALHCPVFSISGMDDFNFMETARYLFQEKSIPANLNIELTGASHDWPDPQRLANAFGFLYLSCRAADIPPVSKSQLKEYCKIQLTRIDTLKENGEYLKAAQVARNMMSTAPFNSDKSFSAGYSDLKANPGFISQMNRLEKCLNMEINARQPYLDAFMTKDSLWWKNEIRSIEQKIKTEQDPFTVDMYLRIKGYWGIACYSLGNQTVKERDPEKLGRIVTVYRMLEPENSYAIYLSAFPYYWKGDNAAAIAILKKAIDEGFADMGQLRSEFPEAVSSKI